MKKITKAEAVERLDKIAKELSTDPERAHGTADLVLLELAPAEVREAYDRVVNACPWWASA